MSNRQTTDLSASLSKAHRRFEQWRNRHRPRARLPEALWDEAVKQARVHGINKTARALGLDYYSLKKHLDTASTPGVDPGKGGADFIELLPAAISPARSECTIELADETGAKMRIHIKGAELPDLATLVHVFRGEGP